MRIPSPPYPPGRPGIYQLPSAPTALALVVFGLVSLFAATTRAQTQVVEFREPALRLYELDLPVAQRRSGPGEAWLTARRAGTTNTLQLGPKVVLRLKPDVDLPSLIAGTSLELDRTWGPNVFTLRAPDAANAVREAARLAAMPGVEASHPIRRRPIKLHGSYAPAPNDPSFPSAWHLENRDPKTAQRLGVDLNLRGAWSTTRGEGVMVAIGDDGADLGHPDLATNTSGGPHYNFLTSSANGNHTYSTQEHGTAVAGLIIGAGGNHEGALGTAPAARLASWLIFGATGSLADEEQVASMFQYALDQVAVQNHSWGNAGEEQLALSAVEDAAIHTAITEGRTGRGVVMVRAAGNEREQLNDANDDGFAQDPRVITVGAVRNTGRATSYSTPGACLLVAAPSGDDNVSLPNDIITNYPTLFTTDRRGTQGYNSSPTDAGGDYGSGATGFSGTSGATPQITGIVALMLAANPHLTLRDAQQALLLSARQVDLADPAIRTNGAGLRVSHNTGFGLPDAALAIALAKQWSNSPPASTVTVTNTVGGNIPDDCLRVVVTGSRVPVGLDSIPAYPSDAPHPDDPTASLDLIDVGQALEPIPRDLRGRGALIQRGGNYFVEKIQNAADAGAAFAIIWNNTGGTERIYMNGADIQFSTIPAIFISQNQGQALKDYLWQSFGTRAKLQLNTLAFSFNVTTALVCEHVRLRVRMDHPRRADVRITLISPSGTRSILHHLNNDTTFPLDEWDFYSVQHYFEPTVGTWRVEFSDERPDVVGRVNRLELRLTGVPITDTDADGLADIWEAKWYGTLARKATDDSDRDGWSNACEQVLGRNPTAPDDDLRLDLSPWNSQLARLSFPSSPAYRYEVLTSDNLSTPARVLTNLAGQFPETELFLPVPTTDQFLNLRQVTR